MLHSEVPAGEWRQALRALLDEVAPGRDEDAEILRWIHHLAVRQARRSEIDAVEAARDRVRARSGVPLVSLHDAEFRVFSQWGEDGILQALTREVEVPGRRFVEIGVEDYHESNTRLLVLKDGWRGLLVDADDRAIRSIREQEICWRHELALLPLRVTAENVEAALLAEGVPEDLDLLSIDIDGNDYWVWRALERIRPRIVVCEYNAVFGADDAVVVPYVPDFDRRRTHESCLCFGASLPALCRVADEKGYRFVGANSAGVNAFFVREDVAAGLPSLSAAEGFVPSRHRESRDADGRLSFLGGDARRAAIAGCTLWSLDEERLVQVRDLAPAGDA